MSIFTVISTLFRRRRLVLALARRAWALRHAGRALGWLWVPLSTGVQLLLYTTIFSMVLGIKLAEVGGVRPAFGLYLMVGLVPFLAVGDVIRRALAVVRDQAALVQRSRVPLEVLVVGEAAGTLANHAVALVAVLVAAMIWGQPTLAGLPVLVLGLALILVLALGWALALAVAGAFVPDLGEVLELLLQVALYGAPIVYPATVLASLPTWLQTAQQLDPATGLVSLFHHALLGLAPPSALALGVVGAFALIGLVLGCLLIEKARPLVADLV